jgi:LysM repeat protein
MKNITSPTRTKTFTAERMILSGAWLVAASLVLLFGYLFWRARTTLAAAPSPSSPPGTAETVIIVPTLAPVDVNLPDFSLEPTPASLDRESDLYTIIPTRPREDVITYTVSPGDSVFEIAINFNLKPETVLWANYATLKDSPDMISEGMVLNIPPVDGVYYEWQAGDSIEGVASKFEATVADILNWSGNRLDLTDPQVEPGQWIMVQNGRREFVQWVIPTIPRGSAGVSTSLYGGGACSGSYDGAYGTGFFIWPAPNHVLSGNDYWSGHLGIDIAAALGDPIYASVSGVIVFAGGAYGGYGNMVMIDHGNGYQTLYAHLSSVATSCGRSVSQGQLIAYAGSTGNSTGAHLHFEIRYSGGFLNPWYYLP